MIDQRKKRLLLVLLTISLVRQTNSNDELLGFKRALRKTERQRRALQDDEGTTTTTLGIEELLESQGWTAELETDQGTYFNTGVVIDSTKNTGDFETEKVLAIQKDEQKTNDLNQDGERSKEARRKRTPRSPPRPPEQLISSRSIGNDTMMDDYFPTSSPKSGTDDFYPYPQPNGAPIHDLPTSGKGKGGKGEEKGGKGKGGKGKSKDDKTKSKKSKSKSKGSVWPPIQSAPPLPPFVPTSHPVSSPSSNPAKDETSLPTTSPYPTVTAMPTATPIPTSGTIIPSITRGPTGLEIPTGLPTPCTGRDCDRPVRPVR